MATVDEVVNWAINLANAGVGVDNDGVYGTQCVDLPAYISTHWFGKGLPGNAIYLLDSAAANGYEVIYDAPGVNPKKGDIFVKSEPYHSFGHTGLVIEDSDGYTIKTIEQNIDGNTDALYVGGPARFNTRNFNRIIGWFRPPYEDDKSNNSQEEDMSFSFHIDGDPGWDPGTIYFYNAFTNEIQGFHNPEELKYVREVYRDINGRDLKHYDWNNMVPVYVRVFGTLCPKRTV